jgi:hypothetical protein
MVPPVAWRRAIAASFIWLVANAVAGAAFGFAAVPFMSLGIGFIFIAAVLAGCFFGVAQWLALRPFFRDVRLWAPATIVASPMSWSIGLMFGGLTLGLGGWLGGGFSAAVQSVVLATSARNDELSLKLSFLWIPASVIGGAVFYICLAYGALGTGTSLNYYLTASPLEWIFLGSFGYALVTVPCVALLVAVAGRKSAPNSAIVTP